MGTRNNQPDSMKKTARKHERLTFIAHHCAPRHAVGIMQQPSLSWHSSMPLRLGAADELNPASCDEKRILAERDEKLDKKSVAIRTVEPEIVHDLLV